MSLNPGQFKGPLFHGTTFDVQGKDIVPAKRLDPTKSNWEEAGHSGQSSRDHAFASESEHIAWQFGSQASSIQRYKAAAIQAANERTSPEVSRLMGMAHPEPQAVPEVGRVRVHTVAPNPMMQRGVYHGDHPNFSEHTEDLQEWKSPAFRITGTHDIMPGRQGTFPQLNWNQFSKGQPNQDANHPDDHSAKFGMNGKKAIDGARAQNSLEMEGSVDEHQMDLFSGKTVGEHAENDQSALGDYHRNNLFGRL